MLKKNQLHNSMDNEGDNYELLRSEISRRYSSLSDKLQQVASFALSNPTEMALEPISAIADRANVHPSALVRFAKAFGFLAFSELRLIYRGRLTARSNTYKERRKSECAQTPSSDAFSRFEQYCSYGIAALNDILDSQPAEELATASSLLAAANDIYVLADYYSLPIAAYAANELNSSCVRACFLGSALSRPFVESRDGSVLLMFSIAPSTSELNDAAQQFFDRSIPIVLVAGSETNPIKALSAVCMVIENAELRTVDSIPAAMTVAQALTLSSSPEIAKSDQISSLSAHA